MRTFDLTPFHRSTIGFDRLFALLDQASGQEPQGQSYPPYNIERTTENAYRITIAVAGFSEADLTIEAAANTLTVKGDKAEAANSDGEVLFRGIAGRSFERRFQLADHVIVQGARLEHGLLHIDLVRELPEAMKPRTIAIGTGATAKAVKPKAITQVQAAA
jgi:molecular chaperone IbpA